MLKQFKRLARNWWGLLVTVPSVTALIIGICLLGWLQIPEWYALDILFKLRPKEPTDERIVIVGLEETDIQKFETYEQVVSDLVLAELLNKINKYQPRLIGLDIFRDRPVGPGYEKLVEVFKATPNLIGVEKILGEKISPNPVLKELGQISDASVIIDGDGVLRRGILYPLAKEDKTLLGFGLAVALSYLEKSGITPIISEEDWLQLGEVKFPPFEANDGGYQNANAGSYQTLINFRNAQFTRVSFSEILSNNIDPNLIQDRIVLIGSTAISKKDYYYTPYSRGLITTPPRTYGVEIHAHMTSQILSAVLDNRPLIKVWLSPKENLWMALWVTLTAWGIWSVRSTENGWRLLQIIVSGTIGLSVLLMGITYLAFQGGWWLSLVAPLLGIWLSSTFLSGYIFPKRIMDYQRHLEAMVAQRTQQLEEKNKQLQATQEQLIAREKLAVLGSVILGVAHEIKNPIGLIINFADITLKLEPELQEVLESQAEYLDAEGFVKLNEIWLKIIEKLNAIKKQSNKITAVLQRLLSHANQDLAEPTETDLNKLVSEAWNLVVYSQVQRRVNLGVTTNFDEAIGSVKIMALDLSRALINLIDNACYELEKKKERLGESFTPIVSLSTKNLVDKVEIIIQDNGSGIPPELEKKIFEPFQTTKPSGEGTGLGLSIAKEIIEGKHRGELKLETVVGEYTKFVIRLPKNSF